mmetsp:Transcript_110370/g.276321  ORF Transcript_110370/g.276321 Transcript_110370/m.276321 type:complete len:250 (+) Transcript_110370:53-802(+)
MAKRKEEAGVTCSEAPPDSPCKRAALSSSATAAPPPPTTIDLTAASARGEEGPRAGAMAAAAAERRGGEVVIGFYGHSPSKKYSEFSNFFWQRRPYDFVLPSFAQREGFQGSVSCHFSEKAIMVSKAAMMNDRRVFHQMLQCDSPSAVKALGRKVSNFDNRLWTEHLEELAFEVVRQKFESDSEIAAVLLSTGDATIAEATRNDKIWGIGIDVGDPRVQDPKQWLGKNILGTALMRTREHLRRSGGLAS